MTARLTGRVLTPRGPGKIVSTLHPINGGPLSYIVRLDLASKPEPVKGNRPALSKPYTPLNRHGVYFRREISEEPKAGPKWQRKMPQRAGKYWVADFNGNPAGLLDVVDGRDTEVGWFFTPSHPNRQQGPDLSILPGTSWGGYWWPVPIMPPPFAPVQCECVYPTRE